MRLNCFVFVLAFYPLSGFSMKPPAGFETIVQCDSCNIHLVVEHMDSSARAAVLFIPGSGYFDHRGCRDPEQKGDCIFDLWSKRLTRAGFATVRYDPPGTGKSGGHLGLAPESAFICVTRFLMRGRRPFRKPYLIFNSDPQCFLLKKLFKLMAQKPLGIGRYPSGLIQIGNECSQDLNRINMKLPVLELTDLAEGGEKITESLIKSPTNSVMPQISRKIYTRVNSELCLISIKQKELALAPKYVMVDTCRYPLELFEDVTEWIGSVLRPDP